MIWKYFYSSHSSTHYGTLCQLCDKLNPTNVIKTPKSIVNGLAISAALFIMDAVPNNPSDTSLHDMWGLPDTERKEALMNMWTGL